MIKKLPASVGGIRDVGSIPGLGRSPGGAWQATVHGGRIEWDRIGVT